MTFNLSTYLDSTYLKTHGQAEITESENKSIVQDCIQEAIQENFKLVMIRPEMVSMAKKMIQEASSKLLIGTVIDFPLGISSVEIKLEEAKKAILDGADDLDFVCNYEAFKAGNIDLVKEEILLCTQLGIANNKTVKWIIEVAALNEKQIIQLTVLIKNSVVSNFKEENYHSVFIKSSTGFYTTENNLPNGATLPSIVIMLENANPLPVKAAGGIKTYEQAAAMIRLGVKRIGTSNAKSIINNTVSSNEY